MSPSSEPDASVTKTVLAAQVPKTAKLVVLMSFLKLSFQWSISLGQVAVEQLPPEVSVGAAESVLFAGKAVRVLRQPSKAAMEGCLLPAEDALNIAEAIRRLQNQPVFNGIAFERMVEGVRGKVGGAPKSGLEKDDVCMISGICIAWKSLPP